MGSIDLGIVSIKWGAAFLSVLLTLLGAIAAWWVAKRLSTIKITGLEIDFSGVDVEEGTPPKANRKNTRINDAVEALHRPMKLSTPLVRYWQQ